jgi:hypothetical protein
MYSHSELIFQSVVIEKEYVEDRWKRPIVVSQAVTKKKYSTMGWIRTSDLPTVERVVGT